MFSIILVSLIVILSVPKLQSLSTKLCEILIQFKKVVFSIVSADTNDTDLSTKTQYQNTLLKNNKKLI